MNKTDIKKYNFEVWKEQEKIAMHFNDLLIKLRTQSLAAVTSISIATFGIAKIKNTETLNYEIITNILYFSCFMDSNWFFRLSLL